MIVGYLSHLARPKVVLPLAAGSLGGGPGGSALLLGMAPDTMLACGLAAGQHVLVRHETCRRNIAVKL